MNYLRVCLDPRVIAAVAVAGALVVFFAPGLITAAIPLLMVAVCPASMVVMMRSMGNGSTAPVPATGNRAADLRRELADLAERQRRLESELADGVPHRKRTLLRLRVKLMDPHEASCAEPPL